MLKLEDSFKGEKSLGVMDYEPPCTRPAWPVLTKEGSGGVRGAVRSYLGADPSTRLYNVFLFTRFIFYQIPH